MSLFQGFRRRSRNRSFAEGAARRRINRHRRRPQLEILEQWQLLSTFTVTSAADDGSAGTLRAVIDLVNADQEASSIIEFNIDGGTSDQTISPLSQLPAFTHQVSILGYTQSGGLYPITIDGSLAGSSDGLVFDPGSDGSGIGQIEVRNFGGSGVVFNSGSNSIGSCSITSNGNSGIVINSDNNQVPALNVISSNAVYGVNVASGVSNYISYNSIYGNGSTEAGAGIFLGPGANNDQPAPELSFATPVTVDEVKSVEVVGTVSGTPSTYYTIDVYSDDGDQGKDYLGFFSVWIQPFGSGDFDEIIPIPATVGDLLGNITATAINFDTNDTSMFSAPFALEDPLDSFFVTTTADNGENDNPTEGSLRAAIIGANSDPNYSQIFFDLPSEEMGPDGCYRIQPPTVLPNIVYQTNISGSSQPGWTSTPIVVLDGYALGTLDINSNGLTFESTAGLSAVESLVIQRFEVGILSYANQEVDIRLSFIGTTCDGTATIDGFGDTGNATWGVIVAGGSYHQIYGATVGEAETFVPTVISGNKQGGVAFIGESATGNLISQSFIGTDVTGTVALGNVYGGVYIGLGEGFTLPTNVTGASYGNTLELNVISGNQNNGIGLEGTSGNSITDNYIGTDVSGTNALGNLFNGISLLNSSGNTIGGIATGPSILGSPGNLISANGLNGISIVDASEVGDEAVGVNNVVQGNFIGTDFQGTTSASLDYEARLGNGLSGVYIENSANNLIGGGTNGGSTPGGGNLISGNYYDPYTETPLGGGPLGGVHINGENATGNTVQSNFIGTDATGQSAIPNGNDGVTLINGANFNLIGGDIFAGEGNVLSGNLGVGVAMDFGANNNVIQGNQIGTNNGGSSAIPNMGFAGVAVIFASGNEIGGANGSGRGNLISGNGGSGVAIHGLDSIGNFVVGNTIGLDLTGSYPIPNGANGVSIYNNASGNYVGVDPDEVIGSVAETYGNVISGNGTWGVAIFDGAYENLVGYNIIGLDPTGQIARLAGEDTELYTDDDVLFGNVFGGVLVSSGANTNYIGGRYVPDTFADDFPNTISANGYQDHNFFAGGQVTISGLGSDPFVGAFDNQVSGNFIGTNKGGTFGFLQVAGRDPDTDAPILDYGGTGVGIINGASFNLVGQDFSGLGKRNIISGNDHGVAISDAHDNLVAHNYIGTDVTGEIAIGNAYHGVRLGDDPNTAPDTVNNIIYGNVITDTDRETIYADSPGVHDNDIEANYIGTNKDGDAVLGTGGDVHFAVGSHDNTVLFNVMRSLTIDDSYGVSAHNMTVQGNLIGVGLTGASLSGNGVFIGNSYDNLIGGSDPGDGNIISGNNFDGVRIVGSGTGGDSKAATGNKVQGNSIGTGLGNGWSGVRIDGGATDNTVGGSVAAGEGNIIVSSTLDGVTIVDPGTSRNVVAGNSIGTNPGGDSGLGNTNAGVAIFNSASANTVGGASADFGNVIGSSGFSGITISNSGTDSNVVANNIIGTDSTGAINLPNAGGVAIFDNAAHNVVASGNKIWHNNNSGVAISGDAHDNSVAGNTISANAESGVAIFNSADDNTIGGAGNVISDNDGDGVGISGSDGTLVQGNSILSNGFNGVAIYGGATNTTVGALTSTPGSGEGNWIAGNTFAGISIHGEGTSGTLVEGNLIGTDADGTAAMANGYSGVEIYGGATSNTVGGTVADARNVLSGNALRGVTISDAGTSNNVVAGNYIGTNITGTAALGNTLQGVAIQAGATDNTIGGLSATPGTGAGNVISGNGFDDTVRSGVVIFDEGTSNNVVWGNVIGLNALGNSAIPNANNGVIIQLGATNNVVGGTAAGSGNVISGNAHSGIGFTDAATTDNWVVGNWIGTGADGTSNHGNGEAGVSIADAGGMTIVNNLIGFNTGAGVAMTNSSGNLIQANLIGTDSGGVLNMGNHAGVTAFDESNNNTIGGTNDGDGNVIAFNATNGVTIGRNLDDNSQGNTIERNSIYGNVGVAIKLGEAATGDATLGPNRLQTAPAITYAFKDAAGLHVKGTLANTVAGHTYRIEFFANPATETQAKVFLGALTGIVGTGGTVGFLFNLTPSSVGVGQTITATATDTSLGFGDTSEVSTASKVVDVINVTDVVKVTQGAFSYNRTTKRFKRSVVVKNTGTVAITGNVYVVLDSLLNATLFNKSGMTTPANPPVGSPYKTIVIAALAPGASTSTSLEFDTGGVIIQPTYTVRILAGPGTP